MGATTYLVPPLTIFLAWLLLDEAPAPLAFAGGALCLLGVAISRHKPKSKTGQTSAPSPDETVPAPD